ncbi:ORFIII-like polyprotein [Tanacetum coccineum]
MSASVALSRGKRSLGHGVQKGYIGGINTIIKRIRGAKIFSKFDLKSGFHQVAIDRESIPWTAFLVPGGLYEWLVMPFGLKNAPAVFQRKMDKCFKGTESFIAVYIDDILVFSKNEKDHAKHLERMLRICEDNGLVLSPTKMKIAVPTVDFLGAVIGEGTIKLQPHIIKKIVNFNEEELKTKKGLRSFLGILNYARNHIPKLGILLRPLYEKTNAHGDKRLKPSDYELVKKNQRTSSKSSRPGNSTRKCLYHPGNRWMHGRMGRNSQMEKEQGGSKNHASLQMGLPILILILSFVWQDFHPIVVVTFPGVTSLFENSSPQPVAATSFIKVMSGGAKSFSAEAEYPGVANVVAETCWLRNLLRELHTSLSSATFVYSDNVSVVYMSSNPVQHQRTKHIKIEIHIVRDLVAVGQVRVLHVLSRYQYADIFTKVLPSALFEEFRTSLSVRCPLAKTAGEC